MAAAFPFALRMPRAVVAVADPAAPMTTSLAPSAEPLVGRVRVVGVTLSTFPSTIAAATLPFVSSRTSSTPFVSSRTSSTPMISIDVLASVATMVPLIGCVPHVALFDVPVGMLVVDLMVLLPLLLGDWGEAVGLMLAQHWGEIGCGRKLAASVGRGDG